MGDRAQTNKSPASAADPKLEPFLAACELFKGCDKGIVSRAATLVQSVEVPEGAAALTAGAPSEGLGIVFSGKLSVRLPDGTEIESLGPGDYFGETGLVLGGASPTTLVALEQTRLLWMPKDAAAGLIRKVQPVAEGVLRKMAEQLSRVCSMDRAPVGLTELVPEDEPSEPSRPPTRGDSSNPFAPPEEEEAEPTSGIPFVEVGDYDLQPSVMAMIPGKLVRQHRILPLKLAGTKLTVGMVAPRNPAAVAELRRVLPTVELEVVAISADDFAHAVVRLRLDTSATPRPLKQSGPSINPDSLTFEAAVDAEREGPPARAIGDEVIRFVNRLIVAAIDRE
ncbi:MAG TPA: cyclic nucleotide-binding domain-containing protein, partial [Myxococcales bacterium]|nr:cyclic nucleotide-binding domain-containing protein [Myxococcales bacterium]